MIWLDNVEDARREVENLGHAVRAAERALSGYEPGPGDLRQAATELRAEVSSIELAEALERLVAGD